MQNAGESTICPSLLDIRETELNIKGRRRRVVIGRHGATNMTTKLKATIEDLYNIPEHGKAEIVDGEIVRFMPTGAMPSRAAVFICSSLLDHERNTKSGHAFPDNTGFIVDLPNRQSFSPDAAWYVGSIKSMRFLEGAPVFTVEVR